MRPIRLIFEGFACFKERQEIDFSSLELFAIAGPTGAGKSSILDAMIFALYGKVPRVSKQYSELISLGRDRISVLLDFRIGDQNYRVARKARRSGGAGAQLVKILGDKEQPIADQVRDVDRKVEEILGLSYEAFTQSVVLPQGDFARFLKSKPADRREIVRDLLRLQIYERMRQRAARLKEDGGANLSSLVKRLEQDYAGATREALDQLSAHSEEAARENAERSAHLKKEVAKVADLRGRRAKTTELEKKQVSAAALEKRDSEIAQYRARLEGAKRAAPLLPLIKASTDAQAAVADEEKDLEALKKTLITRERAKEKTAEKLMTARTAAQKLPSLEARISALDGLKGTIKNRATATARLEKARKDKKTSDERLKDKRQEIAEAKKHLAKMTSAAADADAKVRRIKFDADAATELKKARERATQLRATREALNEAENDARKKERLATTAEKTAKRKRGESEVASKAHAHASERAEASRRALAEAEQRDQAAQLRAVLRVGEPCPVCERDVTQLPPKGRTLQLDRLRTALVEAIETETAAETEASNLNKEASDAESVAKHSRETAKELRSKAEILAGKLAKLEAALRDVSSKVTDDDGEHVEERVLSAIARTDELRELHEAADKEKRAAESAIEKAQSRVDVSLAELESCERQAEALAANIGEYAGEIEKLIAEITKVTDRDDPVEEREELALECAEIEAAQKDAQEKDADAVTALTEAKSLHKEGEKRLRAAEKVDEAKRKELDTALDSSNFDNVDEVKAALLSKEDQKKLEQSIKTHDEERTSTEKRIAELQTELLGAFVNAEVLEKAERDLEQLQEAHERGVERAGTLKAQVAELGRKLAAAEQLAKELETARREFATYEQLASDLRSDRFQEFILKEAFTDLVDGASHRLLSLSGGRYMLEVLESDFLVIDHDNARERRSADTLSGGETFLASLALALELSQQVQRAAGAVLLDSLFIDEGFGTLDPETLETATEAIESLPVGGRMVGIITHIPELTARMPAQVRVEKRPDGSRIVLQPVDAS